MAEYEGKSKRRKKKIMRTFKINEISGVDRPAQAPARALLMKRNDEPTAELDKAMGGKAALTTSDMGHTHLVPLEDFEGEEMRSGLTSFAEGHDHPWVMGEDGTVTIGWMNDHTHTIDVVGKRQHLEDEQEKRTFTSEQREALAESGAAMSDGSFPIENKADLSNAIQAFGRAKDKPGVARHIKRRAKALGASDMLPTEGKLADLLGKSADDDSAGDPGQLEDNHMTDKTQKAEVQKPTVEELEAKLAKAEQLATLSDSHKEHYKSLEGEAAEAFLAKSAEERQAEIDAISKAASEDDPVVYTTHEGVAIHKSAGDAVVEALKKADDIVKKNEELQKQNERNALEKRAESDLSHLPGEMDVHVALLKAVDGIEKEELREKAHAALKAHSENMSGAFDTYGHGGQIEKDDSAEGKLDELAKNYAKEHNMSYEKAYSAVLDTEEGSSLYAKAYG